MHMVRHHYEFIDSDISRHLQQVLLNNYTEWRQLYLRGVVNAAPYNFTKQLFLIVGTECNKIAAGGGVIVLSQTGWLSNRTAHFCKPFAHAIIHTKMALRARSV